jgi:putative PIN family toxin of toxin-antitoxin system
VPQSWLRIVIDTNTLLRGLVSANSAAARVRRAAERRAFISLLSKPVIDEYRSVLLDPLIAKKFPEITNQVVELTVRRLRFLGEYVRSPNVRFDYKRDETDQKFLELAIGLRATQILTSDKDLLSLPKDHSEAGRRLRQRLPGLEILEAGDFLRKYRHQLGIE